MLADSLSSSAAATAAADPAGAVASVRQLLAAIPSPSRSSISIGPLDVRAYGVAIGVSVLVAVWITSRRFQRFSAEAGDVRNGDTVPNDAIGSMAVWAVPAGLVGARLYHVITDFDRYRDNLGDIHKIWNGGLGVWGGITLGVLVGSWWLRRNGYSVARALDAVAPALAVAQAIGRLGNWFNQELYGRPTDLPWALEIDPAHRVAGYNLNETFHPTFAYEIVWNLALAASLVWLVPKVLPRLREGYLLAVYVVGYTAGRVWIELLRIDHATELWGLRINVWTSIGVGLAGLAAVLVGLRRQDAQRLAGSADDDGEDGEVDDDVVSADSNSADTTP